MLNCNGSGFWKPFGVLGQVGLQITVWVGMLGDNINNSPLRDFGILREVQIETNTLGNILMWLK